MKRPRRHHYMPAFLLARFAHSGIGRKARVRCLLRRGGVVDTAVLNVGVEKDFHSESGLFRDAEGMLSSREAEFAKQLDRWVPGPLDRLGSAAAEEMVAQLRLRSREFRELGRRLFSGFVNDGVAVLTRATQRSSPTAALRDDLARAMLETATVNPPVTMEDYKRVADVTLKPLLAAHLNQWVLEGASTLVQDGIDSGLPAEMLAGIHTHLIVLQMINFRRRQALGDCTWHVLKVSGEELVLGDVGPLCLYGRERRLSSLRASNLPMRSIYLPIGPRRLLVGSYGARFTVPTSARLNNATFALSREFVVGKQTRAWFERRTRFSSRVDEFSAERTLGVEVPSAAELLDPILEAARGWVLSVIDRHWTAKSVLRTSALDASIEAKPLEAISPSIRAEFRQESGQIR